MAKAALVLFISHFFVAALTLHVIGVWKPHHLAFSFQRIVTFGAFGDGIAFLPDVLSIFEDMMALPAVEPIVFNVSLVGEQDSPSPSRSVAFTLDGNLLGHIRCRQSTYYSQGEGRKKNRCRYQRPFLHVRTFLLSSGIRVGALRGIFGDSDRFTRIDAETPPAGLVCISGRTLA